MEPVKAAMTASARIQAELDDFADLTRAAQELLSELRTDGTSTIFGGASKESMDDTERYRLDIATRADASARVDAPCSEPGP